MRDEHWIKYKGRVHGPFTVSQLRSGLKRGKLSRSHGVSDNRRTWQPLGDMLAELDAAARQAPEFSGVPMAPEHEPGEPMAPAGSGQVMSPAFGAPGQAAQLPPQHSARNGHALDPASSLLMYAQTIKAWLLVGGITLLVFVLLPTHIRVDGDGTAVDWLWSDFTEYPIALQLGIILSLLSGVALIVLSIVIRGMPRGIATTAAFVAISALALGSILSGPSSYWQRILLTWDDRLLAFMLAPLTMAPVFAAAKWRMLGPTLPRRVILCVVASLAAIATLIAIIWVPVEMLGEHRGKPPTQFPVCLFVWLIFYGGTAITAGVLGILGVRPSASHRSLSACTFFAWLTVAIPPLVFAAFTVWNFIVINGSPPWQAVITDVFDLLKFAMGVPLFFAAAWATCELMISCSAFMANRPGSRSAPPPGPGPDNHPSTPST